MGHFQQDKDLRETTTMWIAQHITVDREGVDWVLEPRSLIKKDNLRFAAMFIWHLVRHRLCPTDAENILT